MMYRVRNWEEYFENHDSRKVRGVRWVPMPNKHDGKGYRRIAQRADGVQVFCAWTLILQVASKMPVRGTLADEDGALDADDLSAMTGFPAAIFETAFEALTEPKIGWLEIAPADEVTIPYEPQSPETSRDFPASPGVTGESAVEGKGTEGDGKRRKASSPSGEIDSKVESVAGANAPDTPQAFTVLGYLQYLARQPAFNHIDPAVEESKIKIWHARAPNQKRRITQRFLETWVGRIERPLSASNGSAAEKPKPDERPELTPEQIQEQVNVFVEMLRDGRSIESIGEQFAATFRRSQWGQIRSAALAQYATPQREPPEPPAETPPPSGQVVEFASRAPR